MISTEMRAMLDHESTTGGTGAVAGCCAHSSPPSGSPPCARLLDAGCGSGRTLEELAAYGRVSGADLSSAAIASARRRGYRDVHTAPVEDLPFAAASFDVVTCLDVLEHTQDDRATLIELLRVTRPGGSLIVTVPAYPRLWSRHDEANLHFRRYDARGLRAVATAAGWEVVRETHFNAALLVPAAVVRRVRRPHEGLRRPTRSGTRPRRARGS